MNAGGKLFFLLCFTCVFSTAEAQEIPDAAKLHYLSVARLSVIQKGNDFFARYRVSLNNAGRDTLWFYQHTCAQTQYSADQAFVQVYQPDCDRKAGQVLKLAPGTKFSREVVLTGHTREVQHNPAFRIVYCLQRLDDRGKRPKHPCTTIRSPKLHLR